MNCECGFQFAGPGEFRNCAGYVNSFGESVVICPECGRQYANIFSADARMVDGPEIQEQSHDESESL